MKVSATEIEQRQVVLDIEVEPGRVARALDQAVQRASSRLNVPGFRKGKAPRPLIERMVGTEVLFEDAIEHLIPQVYGEAVKEQGISPFGQPSFEVVSTDPLQVKATVPLEPKVALGDYRGVRVPRPAAEPTDEDVEGVLNHLRETHAEWVPVERAVQLGDRVVLDLKSEVDGRVLTDSTNAETILNPERPQPAPGFDEALIGAAAEETRTFTLPLPDDYSDREAAGKDAQFTVMVHTIKERRLPELDDEFAQQVGQEYESFGQLREAIEGQVRESKTKTGEREQDDAVMAAVVERSTIEIPPQLVQRQAEQMLQNMASNLERQGLTLERYVRLTGQPVEEFRARIDADARAALTRALVIDAVADAEQIAISDDDVNAELLQLVSASPDAPEEGSPPPSFSPELIDRVRSALRQRSATRRLIEIAGQEAPATEQPEAAPEAVEQPEAAPEEEGTHVAP